ncbi:MAG: Uma2 family endonuclease [Rubrobacteraceae bacterium]
MQKTKVEAGKVEKKLFTVEEYHRMVEAGVLDEGNKVELIEGEIYPMAAMGSRHAACVRRINALLGDRMEPGMVVSPQCPVQLDDNSEPEPDIALLKPRNDFYADAHPRPKDVLISIEVSDTSLERDAQIKLPAYARSGIPEVWIVNLINDFIEVHSRPATGEYRSTLRVRSGETFRSESLPGTDIAAKDILG